MTEDKPDYDTIKPDGNHILQVEVNGATHEEGTGRAANIASAYFGEGSKFTLVETVAEPFVTPDAVIRSFAVSCIFRLDSLPA